jgi:GNAT superfamily N-acetyltransferase
MTIDVRRATAAEFPALERLFGRGGASNGCWCMYWRLGPEYHKRDRDLNHEALRERVAAEPSPGLLAFEPGSDTAIGWLQLTPRAELGWLNQVRFLAPVDDLEVWSISCLYIASRHRAHGVGTALVAAAVDEARDAGVPAVEAYPVDAVVPGATRNAFTGYASTFFTSGFVEVARRRPERPIVRYSFTRQ